MKLTEISSILGTWVGIGGALLGGYLALQSYRADVATRAATEHKQVNEKVQAAFRIVEEFHRPDFIALRSRFVGSFEQQAYCRDFTPPSAVSVQEVFTLVEYFDRADLCVKNGLCDTTTTGQLLTPYANAWWPYLADQIEHTRHREGTPAGQGYGIGLRAFATKPAEGIACASKKDNALRTRPRYSVYDTQ
jgi:hypothetical protein